jgi:hypothetical protein
MSERPANVQPEAENFRMGQPEDESGVEPESADVSLNPSTVEQTDITAEADTPSVQQEVSPEYIEKLQQGISQIELSFQRLTWELSVPDEVRIRLSQEIQQKTRDYLVAGLAQPETAGTVLKMLADYCTESGQTDLFPFIEQIITDRSDRADQSIARFTAPEFDQLFAITGKLAAHQNDTDQTSQAATEDESAVKQYLQQHVIPLALQKVSQDWKFDETGSIATKIAELGDAEQQQLLRQAVLDHLAADPQSLTIIDTWQSMAKDSEKMSQELGQLVEEGLTRLQLDTPAILADWRVGSGGEFMPGMITDQKLVDESLAQNFKAVTLLEQYSPGTTTRLQNEYSIKLPGRYPIEMLIRQLEAPPHPGDSYGIMILPEADENGAFLSQREVYRKLYDSMEQNQKVVVFEATDVLDLVSHINKTRHKYESVGKMSFAIIGGHGQDYSLRLGGTRYDRKYNDVQMRRTELSDADLFRPGAQAVNECFDDDADIILVACKAGSDMGLSFEISMEKPEAIVTAPKISAGLQSLEAYTKPNGKVGVRGEFTQNSTSRRIDGDEQII